MARPRLELLAGHAAVLFIDLVTVSPSVFCHPQRSSCHSNLKNAKPWRVITISVFILSRIGTILCFISESPTPLTTDLEAPRRHWREFPCSLPMQETDLL